MRLLAQNLIVHSVHSDCVVFNSDSRVSNLIACENKRKLKIKKKIATQNQ